MVQVIDFFIRKLHCFEYMASDSVPSFKVVQISRRTDGPKKLFGKVVKIFLIVFFKIIIAKIIHMGDLSPVTYHLSPITCHLSPVTCHLTTTLCSLSCYESPRRLGDAAADGLHSFPFQSYRGQT